MVMLCIKFARGGRMDGSRIECEILYEEYWPFHHTSLCSPNSMYVAHVYDRREEERDEEKREKWLLVQNTNIRTTEQE